MQLETFHPVVEFLLPKNNLRPVPIEQFIETKSLRRLPNKLNTICLLATGDEVASGEFNDFVSILVDSVKQSELNRVAAAQIDFKVLVMPHVAPRAIWQLQAFFKSVAVIRSKLPTQFNFYDRQGYKIEKNESRDLTYGLKSAPNYHFFEVMQALALYDTALLLETDCYLGDDWLSRVSLYTKYAGGFWISGATYTGLHDNAIAHQHSNHINGGTSLYAVGHLDFQRFLQFCLRVAPKYFEVAPWMPYDCLLEQIIRDHYDHDTNKRALWQFIREQYRPTNLILNYSPERDRGLCDKKIKERTNYAILHKKSCSVPDATLLFWHFPKCGGTHFYEGCLLPALRRTVAQDYGKLRPGLLNLTDKQRHVVAGLVAAGSGLPCSANTTNTMPVDEFFDALHANKISEIFAAKLVARSDYPRHLVMLENLLARPINITLLRQPLARCESEFYYLRDMGTWEPTYGRFTGMSFETYVYSEHFLDNWLVRRLNNILEPEITVTDAHKNVAIELLTRCSIVGFLEEAAAFMAACEENFGVVSYSAAKIWNKNTVSTKQPITDKVQAYFNDRCKYDNQVYEYFWNRRRNGVFVAPAAPVGG